MASKNELKVLRLLIEGNAYAFKKIFLNYQKKVYGFAFTLSRNKEISEDILQEVFIKIWEKRASIDIDKSFTSFLFTVTYNTCMNYFKQKIHEREYKNYYSLQLQKNNISLEEQVEYDELDNNINKIINKLSPRRKEIFLLSRMHGLSYKEIAQKLKISENTVDTTIRKSLEFLREHLHELYPIIIISFFL